MLVTILNEMVDGFVAEDIELCQQKWHQFYRHLQKHFEDEVKIMFDLGFITEEHNDHHEEVLAHARALGANCKSLVDWEVCLYELRNDLLIWILKHDLKFAEHLITIGYNDC